MQVFLADPAVRTALLTGAVVAVACAVVGVFTVIRGQSFAGHALADVGATGGSAAFLLGISPLFGFLAMTVTGAAAMEAIGVRRPRGRDLATGIVLGAGTGISALLLYLSSTLDNTTGAAVTVLFGSIFSLNPSVVPVTAGLTVLTLVLTAVLHRPLLLTALSPELAAARGGPVRATGLAYLVALAIAVALSALTTGAILSTALLIGPAAIAVRLTARPGRAVLLAVLFGVLITWAGVVLAYASYYWPPAGHGWPVSFFIVTLVFLGYLGARCSRTS
jgi:zinc/manganese transport system permease protein